MRRANSTQGSLELLLDTITNTFGGVLFLAILVAMLLQFNGVEAETTSTEPLDPTKLAVLQAELTLATAELESLHRTAAAQAAMRDAVDSPGLEAELETVHRLRLRRNKIFEQRLALLKQIGDTRAAAAEIQAELISLDANLGSART